MRNHDAYIATQKDLSNCHIEAFPPWRDARVNFFGCKVNCYYDKGMNGVMSVIRSVNDRFEVEYNLNFWVTKIERAVPDFVGSQIS